MPRTDHHCGAGLIAPCCSRIRCACCDPRQTPGPATIIPTFPMHTNKACAWIIDADQGGAAQSDGRTPCSRARHGVAICRYAPTAGMAARGHPDGRRSRTKRTRVLLWRPWQTDRVVSVWIRHVGYLWIPGYRAFRAVCEIELVPSPLATHALTVDAIGALTFA